MLTLKELKKVVKAADVTKRIPSEKALETEEIMVFNKTGYPIGQILMPNRDIGHNLSSTHPMVRPDTKELYITTADDVGDEGSWIMKAPAFGKGNKNAYQFL